ncbi:hypothetical protein HDU81_004242 [Chytriomyces hyalinus]|nr:hypothetical protein HDU81_004242 [Chytriomyces hyalinus]
MSETKSLCQAGASKRLLARRSGSSTPSPQPASQAFTCAFHDKFLRQGSLYLQEGADVFRFRSPFMKTEVLIPFADIASIEKSRNLLIPNSITIKTAEREFFLTSFFSRDQAFDAAQKVYRQWHAETLLTRDKAGKTRTTSSVLKTTKLANFDGTLQVSTTDEIFTARVGFNDDEGVGRVARSRSLHIPRSKQADSTTASKTATPITRPSKRLEKSMSSSTLVEAISDVDSVHSVKQPCIAEPRRSKAPLLENGYLLWLMIFMVSVFALASVSMIVFSFGTMKRVLTVVAEFETTVSPTKALA